MSQKKGNFQDKDKPDLLEISVPQSFDCAFCLLVEVIFPEHNLFQIFPTPHIFSACQSFFKAENVSLI